MKFRDKSDNINNMYDLIIIGAGPAGLTASIYSSCFKLNHVVIGQLVGGQMMYAPDIINYPGFQEISGTVLTENMVKQTKARGGTIISETAVSIKKTGNSYFIETDKGNQYESKTVIFATGVERRKLNVQGEIEYTEKGVYYCARCSRFDYGNKIVAVVGGANAAAQTAIQLSHAATKVIIIHRGPSLRADPVWQTKVSQEKNIETVFNTQIIQILGDGQKLTGLKIKTANPTDNTTVEKEIPIERLYIEIGGVPGTALLTSLGTKMDPGGFIEVDETLQTSIPGIFASGDVISRKYSIEQISSAVGSGARAASSVFAYIKQSKAPSLWGEKQITHQQ